MRTKHLAWVCCLFAAVSVRAQPSADAGVTKRAPAKPKLEIATFVDLINSGQLHLPEFFPTKVERAAIDAVSFRPKVLMDMGSLLIRFKHRADALSDSDWERLEAHATRVPATSTPARSLKDSVGERLAPRRKVVAHLVLDGKDETEWNHGESWGVTLLKGDAVVFWHEYW